MGHTTKCKNKIKKLIFYKFLLHLNIILSLGKEKIIPVCERLGMAVSWSSKVLLFSWFSFNIISIVTMELLLHLHPP